MSKVINLKKYKKEKEKKKLEETKAIIAEAESDEINISITVISISDKLILSVNEPITWIKFDEKSFKELLKNIKNQMGWDI